MNARIPLRIRNAVEGDLPSIAAMLNANILESPYVYAEEPVTLEERRGWLHEHQSAGLPIIVASAEQLNSVVGWGSLSPYRSASGYRHTAEVSVYVAGEAHRQGIGARLLAELLDRACAATLRVLIASIDSANAPSIALFERFGFVERARLPDVGQKFGEWRIQLLLHRQVGALERAVGVR